MTTDIASLVSDNLDIWTTAVEPKSGGGRGGGKRTNLYGIDKLRSLILIFAVRGKLLPQDSSDEPAAALLRRLRYVPKASIGDLPEGWAVAPLTALGTFIGGITPSKGVARFWGDGCPWVSPKDMGGNTIDQTEDQVTQSALDETSLQIVPVGSLLMVARSGILRRKFPVAIAGIECTINQDMKALILKPGVDARFLQIMLQGFQPRILTELVKRGMTVESLIFGDFTKALWPLPPVAEQQRIVVKVDELMALCDALEAESTAAMAAHQTLVQALLATLTGSTETADIATSWARLEEHFDTLFTTETSVDALTQTTLELAVRGNLVLQDTTEEPAAEILKRVSRRGNADGGGETLSALPPGWLEVSLDEIIATMDSGWSPACEDFPSRSDDVWGVLKTTAVQVLRFDQDQNKELPAGLKERPDAETKVGDILITRAGPTNRVGICCHVDAVRPRLMISDKLIRFRPAHPDISGKFIALALSVGPAARQLELAKSGMAASQVNISQAKLKSIRLALPPAAEQQRIVQRVEAVMALRESLEVSLRSASATLINVTDSVVERAAA